ncbi:MAG: hypothetical protein ACTSXA_11130 [Candidatus Heimdallarchaeota archaeon]
MIERRKIIEIISIVTIFSLLLGYPIYFFVLNNSPQIKHETNQWMLIRDNDGNKIAVEAINSSLWDSLTMFYQEHENEGEPMSILGVVVSFDNSWQFRLNPSTISMGYGFWKMETYTISEISANLESHLSTTVAIYFTTIQFNNFKNTGMIPFIIDMIVSVVSLLLSSIYFFFKRERNMLAKIKEALLIAKKNPEGITFTKLSQNLGLEQKRIERLISKNNLKEDLDLWITDNQIEFKERIFSQRILQIEEQLRNITHLSHNQLSQENYSKLFQFKKDLEEALIHFRDISDEKKQTQINAMVEIINDLLESIPLERINK